MEQSNEKSIIYITPENARFYLTPHGFPAMEAFLPEKQEDDLAERKEVKWLKQDFGRVFVTRAFPFNDPEKYISVSDRKGYEYGMIKDVAEFEGKGAEIIRSALERKYFIPEIVKINNITDKFGFSFWDVVTDKGKIEFTVKDTYANIIHVSETKLVINDSDGNRFLIKDVLALDSKSYKRIELYI